MELKSYVTFDADFPDDAIENEQGDVEIPPGENIMSHLANRFRERNFQVSDPKQHSYYGWCFTVQYKEAEIWLLIHPPGHWLLLSQVDKTITQTILLKNLDHLHHELLQVLKEILSVDNKIEKVEWYTRKEYEKPPA